MSILFRYGSLLTAESGKKLALDPGTVTVTGMDVSFKHRYSLTLESGAVSITGTDVSLSASRTLALDAGAVTITGIDLNLSAGSKTLFALPGEIAITGTDMGLLASRKLTLESASIAITGTDASFTHRYSLALESGAVSITGTDVGLSVEGRTITLAPGTVTITGSEVAFQKAVRITLESGSVDITGTDMGLVYPYVFTLDPGSVSVTGTDMGLLASRKLILSPGAVTVTGTALSFGFTTSQTARAAAIVYLFTLTGTADGTTDVEIPITSLQARMRSGSPTYLQVVIPGLTQYQTYVTDRPNGTMKIDVAYLEGGAYTLRETIISVALDDIRIDKGPFSRSISLTGRSQTTYSNKSITLYRPIYKNTMNATTRYRFAEPHVYLFPGDTVTVDDDTFTANVISYYVRARTGGVETRMEVGEAA